MTAINRMRASAGRVLAHFGKTRACPDGRRRFRRYEKVKDWTLGEESESLASIPPVFARCSFTTKTTTRSGREEGDARVRIVEEVVHVEIPPFEEFGGLTDEWRVLQDDGSEVRLQNTVENEDQTFYIARYGDGGR